MFLPFFGVVTVPNPQKLNDGKYIIDHFLSCIFNIIHIFLDVRMNSPPVSPPRFELGGASRVTGGILHECAYGNVFNHADAEMEFNLESQMGKVQVYHQHLTHSRP